MKAATRKLVKGVHVGKLGLLQLLHVEKWELKVGLEDTVERCKQSKDAGNDDAYDDDNRGAKTQNFPDSNFLRAKTFRTKCVKSFLTTRLKSAIASHEKKP